MLRKCQCSVHQELAGFEIVRPDAPRLSSSAPVTATPSRIKTTRHPAFSVYSNFVCCKVIIILLQHDFRKGRWHADQAAARV
jgi:hypothetical protein